MNKYKDQVEELGLGRMEGCEHNFEFRQRESNCVESTEIVETIIEEFDDSTDMFLLALFIVYSDT